MDDQENKNIFSIVKGGATEEQDDNLPVNSYVIVDVDNEEYFGSGFLVFTSQHVAVMQETDKGAIPTLVVPLHRVKVTELIVEDED